MPVIAELTVEDIEKIDEKIQASEARTKAHITLQIESTKTLITWLIIVFGALVAIIGVPLAVLTILVGWRSVKDNAQGKQIETLTQEIETLKQQRIVNP